MYICICIYIYIYTQAGGGGGAVVGGADTADGGSAGEGPVGIASSVAQLRL